MTRTALVVGGTGPTGHHVVTGLYRRGYAVTILHSGRHELAETPPEVEHIHADAYSEEALQAALAGRDFDLCIAMYGRLRAIARVSAGRTGRFVSVGGVPAYRGFMNPWLGDPPGLPVPTREEAALVERPEEDDKGFRVARSERAVFESHPGATHFRYPYVYGPYQLVPREWCIVRRILDRRPFIVLPDGGLTLQSYGYTENLAHAVLLAVDRPEAAAGRIYNCADDEVLSLRQVVEIVCRALDWKLEIVAMPWSLALPARPLVMQPAASHRVVDTSRIRHELGYRDRLPPREALAVTARWLAAHPPAAGGPEETVLQDPFDYEAEDRLVASWRQALTRVEKPRFEREPGYTLSYSGPGGRAQSSAFEAGPAGEGRDEGEAGRATREGTR
jgi:nucleoside-diphosphate-sugar epimerase